MFSACTSIKVAVLLNKIADLSKEHSALSTPFFTFSSFFSGFRAVPVGTCSHCRLVPAGGAGTQTRSDYRVAAARNVSTEGILEKKKREYGFFQGGDSFLVESINYGSR